MRFSRRRTCWWRSSGLWRRVILRVVANVSDERIVSICRVNAEAIRSSETSVTTSKATKRRNPKDHDRHFHRRETLKSHNLPLAWRDWGTPINKTSGRNTGPDSNQIRELTTTQHSPVVLNLFTINTPTEWKNGIWYEIRRYARTVR
jgi:hypothetical protein